jgi:hypothetical protein
MGKGEGKRKKPPKYPDSTTKIIVTTRIFLKTTSLPKLACFFADEHGCEPQRWGFLSHGSVKSFRKEANHDHPNFPKNRFEGYRHCRGSNPATSPG